MKPRLQKYLDLTSGTQTPVKAFPEAFEMTTSQLETVLGVYVRGNNFNYEQLSMPNLPAEEVHEAEALGRAEVLYVLGDYLRHTTPWRQADAEEHFREALRIDSNHARAHAALACLLEENDNWTEVQEHFDRAVEVGRDDDLTFFLYGHSLLERSMVQGFPLLPMRLPAQIKKARGYIGRCLELNPNRAEAYVDLGKTYLFDPMDTQAGIAALERGRSLLPARMDIPYYGMMLCVRVGDGECAKGLANHVLVHSEDPQLRETAQQVLGNDASNQTGERIENAIEKLNAGDLKGGIALLKQLREKATDANRQDEIDRLLKEAQESQREAERIDKLNRQIARYNKAVAKARSGDTAGAAAILEELSKTVQDSKLSNQIRDAQKQLGVQPKK